MNTDPEDVHTWRVNRSDYMDSKSVQPGATPGLSATKKIFYFPIQNEYDLHYKREVT